MKNISDNSTQTNSYKLFLEQVENSGIRIFWDEDDEIDPDDSINVYFDDMPCCGMELDPYLESMSIYLAFGYTDLSRWERENLNCQEEIEEDTYTWILERHFESFLSSHSKHVVSTWDDGCYMCKGYTSRVGLHRCECSVETIREFMAFAKTFYSEYGAKDTNTLQNEAIKGVARKHSFSLSTLPFSLCAKSEAVILTELLDTSPLIYHGQEHVLVHTSGRNAAIQKGHWKIVQDILKSTELYDDLSYYLDGKKLSIISSTLFFQLPTQKGAEYVEELFLKNRLKLFHPFASTSMQQLISSIDSQLSVNSPLICTEGQTDWKHIKHALSQIRPDGMSGIQFLEYGNDTEIGNHELLNMCRGLSRLSNPAPRIMVFDRDDPSVNKQFTQHEKYKDWGNRVYSLILPVPPHRKDTPNICIEHYYTDDEIKTEQVISDVPRRLFLGNEFDRLGRAHKLNKLCHQIRHCGPGKITIIDNGVYGFSDPEETNYALSKAGFAELCSSLKISEDAVIAFTKLFKEIKTILEFDQAKYVQ